VNWSRAIVGGAARYLRALAPQLAQASAALGRPRSRVPSGAGPAETRWRTRRLGLLQQADAIAVPSRWPEPFGRVGVAARGVGVSAVVYERGVIREWLRPGVCGEAAASRGGG